MTLTLGSGYVDLSVESVNLPNILLQLVCKLDPCCEVSGKALLQADSHNFMLTGGSAICRCEDSQIEISGGEYGHTMVNIRNYVTDINAKNILINFTTPINKTIRFKWR